MQDDLDKPAPKKWQSLAIKLASVWVGFLILHYLYDFFPSAVTHFFSAVSESIFQHMKIGFWVYTFVSGVEYWLLRKRGALTGQFFRSRVLGVLVFLWAMLIFFYFAPAILGGPMPSEFLEIVNANIVLIVSVCAGLILEREAEGCPFSKAASVMLWAMYLVLLLEFSIFTYRLPWTDVFAVPPGY